MNYTENLSLGLPEYGENADVADLNRNSGILDAYVYNTRQIECEPYDSTKTYMSGDLAIHNEVIYECNTDNTTGTWDDSKWDSTTLAEQIAKAKQMGGESALADLEDVNLTNPSEGQILTYDDTNDEWVNTDMPDTAVTKEASGNPIELTDAASAPMVKCVTEIQGSQDLHGQDKPWVGGAGKNKLEVTATTTTTRGITFTVNDDGTIVANGTATENIVFNIGSFTGRGNYKINGISNGSVSSYYFQMTNLSGSTSIGYFTNGDFDIDVTQNILLRLVVLNGAVLNNVKFYPMIRLATETDPTFVPYSNICPITAYTEGEIEVRGKNIANPSLVATGKSINEQGVMLNMDGFNVFGPYKVGSGETYTISFNPTSESSYTRVHAYNEQDEWISQIIAISTSSATKRSQNFVVPNNAKYIRISIRRNFSDIQLEKSSIATDYEPYTSTTHTTTFPSAIYRGSEDVVNGEVTEEWIVVDLGDFTWTKDASRQIPTFYASLTNPKITPTAWYSNVVCEQYSGKNTALEDGTCSILYNGWLYVCDSRYSTVSDFKTAMSGVKLAYELATPTTSSVTPTNLPIKSLSGYNHIESSTGEMEIEYITDGYQPLVDLIQSNKHVYSTQEQIVGTWIDGSTVYEKTIAISGVVSGVYQISMSGIKDLISYSGYVNDNWTPASMLPIPRVASDGNNIGIGNVYTDYFTLIIPSEFGSRLYDPIITIRYTKSTTTRSLSASLTSQKAQIEPLTDKTEEVPTEEEKAVNEEENNDER